jgi:hypothetical protein
MQCRKILFPLMVVISVMVFVGISPAFALCPPGKVPVTIVNPANKVHELCVSPNAIDKIGGKNDMVIRAHCPCYSQDDIEFILPPGEPLICYVAPGVTKTGTSCTLVQCEDPIFLAAWEGPITPVPKDGDCTRTYPPELRIGIMIATFNGCAVSDGNTDFTIAPLTEAEGDACVAILKTFIK